MISFPQILEWQTWQTGQGLSERTIDARIWRVEELAKFIGSDPASATTIQVSQFMASLAERRNRRGQKMSKSSLSTYYAHLKAWFAWLVKMEYRDDDPMMRVPAPKPKKLAPRPVTNREVEAIFAVNVHRRTHMMLLLAAFQGLRVHEIAKIRGEDVNLLDGLLRVVGKGGTDCVITLHALVAAEAVDYPRKGYWFPTYTRNALHGSEGPILGRSVSDLLGDVFDRAGVDGGGHRLRHWYATTLLHGGASTRLVQTLMRHGSIQSTERYTEIAAGDQATAMARLEMPGSADGIVAVA